jgi:hypothetical protein
MKKTRKLDVCLSYVNEWTTTDGMTDGIFNNLLLGVRIWIFSRTKLRARLLLLFTDNKREDFPQATPHGKRICHQNLPEPFHPSHAGETDIWKHSKEILVDLVSLVSIIFNTQHLK